MAAVGGAGSGSGSGSGSNIPPLVKSLSELTPAVVDHLYGIDTAMRQEKPHFVLLVGAPGVGKSSGHAEAIAREYVPLREAGGYATINLDILLESLLPFRAGSAMGYVLKQKYPEQSSFTSIHMYGSKKENVGAFGWYDDGSETKGRGAAKVTTIVEKARSKIYKLGDAAKENIRKANSVRNSFLPLRDAMTEKSLTDLNDAALKRAILKGVPIIYETTLSKVEKSGRVEKFDALMSLLDSIAPQYTVAIIHLTGETAEVAERMNARQKYEMPYNSLPFYRYVPPSLAADLIFKNNEAVKQIKIDYASRIAEEKIIIPDTITVVRNISRLPVAREFNGNAMMRRVLEVYAPINALANRLSGVSITGGPRGGARRTRRYRRSRHRGTNKKR
jgi:hypothetical protein